MLNSLKGLSISFFSILVGFIMISNPMAVGQRRFKLK